MSQKELEVKLKAYLKELEKAAESVVNSRSFSREVAPIKALKELIREQLSNENISSAARKTR